MTDRTSSSSHVDVVADVAAQVDRLNSQAARVIATQNDMQVAIDCAQRARVLAEESDAYPAGLARSLTLLGQAYLNTSDYTLAVRSASDALMIYHTLEAQVEQIEVWSTLATAYSQLGDYVLALDAALRLLDICQAISDEDGIADAQSLIGIVYMLSEDYGEALAYFQQALALYESLGNRIKQAKVHVNLRTIFAEQEDLDRALAHGLAALRLYRSAQASPFGAHLGLGRIYLKQQDYVAALEQGQAAEEHLDSATPYMQAQLWSFMGTVHVQRSAVAEGIVYLERALELALHIGVKRDQMQCHLQLAHAYKQQSEFERALTHFEGYHALQQEITDIERAARFKNLILRHEVEQAHKEIQRQRTLREADRRHFERLSRLKDEFVHSISHDLQSPLAAINLSLDLLKMRLPGDDEYIHTYMQRIRRAVSGMGDLVSLLLDLARFETQHPAREDVSLLLFLTSMVEDFAVTAQDKQITLHLDPIGPALMGAFDPGQMRRVLQNLISNAVKYTPEAGEVRIGAVMQDRTLVIRVTDTGIGIPDEALPHLFEPFYRVNNDQHRAIHGTGLGLAIVQSIVDAHGGRITVETTLGQGTTFSVLLPQKDE